MDNGFYSQRQAVKRWRKKNPVKVKEANKRWKDNNSERYNAYMSAARRKWIDQNPEKYLFDSAKYRAGKSGLEFSIDLSDIEIPEVCPLLNILMFIEPGHGFNNNCPSIDRIDNSQGYVKGNVWVISRKANSMKNDASLDELKTFARNVMNNFY